MDINFLRTLRTIQDTGSFQNAANKLGYTQSTITFQMQQLEKAFSVKLFEKIGRKMSLTQAGKDIMPYVDTILLSMQHIENYNVSVKDMKGDLNIAMPEAMMIYAMQPVIREFRLKAPHVNISLHAYSCYEISNFIINGDVDIGIHYDIRDYGQNIVKKTLFTFPLVLVAEHGFTGGINDGCTIITSNETQNLFRSDTKKLLRSMNIKPGNMIELGSFEAIKQSVLNKLGIAYLPRFSVEKELSQGVLRELETEAEKDMRSAVYAHHKNKWISPAMELFIHLASEKLSKVYTAI